jgi:hypothetical protein
MNGLSAAPRPCPKSIETEVSALFAYMVARSTRPAGISVKSASYQIPARMYFAARPASQATTPTTAKNTAAQTSQAEILFVMIAIKIVNADIPHREAAARPHQ